MFKGIIPVHSNYSYDGRHTTGEIAAFARARGFAFIAMSEHSDTLDSEKVKRLREASQEALSIYPGSRLYTTAKHLQERFV